MKRKAKKAVTARRPKSLKNTQLKKLAGGVRPEYGEYHGEGVREGWTETRPSPTRKWRQG
jgi:hypothetical protein